MEEARTIKLEKYMEIVIPGDLVKDKFVYETDNNISIYGIDFAKDSNIFYGFNFTNRRWEQIHNYNFEEYAVVSRLTNWSIFNNKESYYLRVIKTNMNDIVDFGEEQEFLKYRIL